MLRRSGDFECLSEFAGSEAYGLKSSNGSFSFICVDSILLATSLIGGAKSLQA